MSKESNGNGRLDRIEHALEALVASKTKQDEKIEVLDHKVEVLDQKVEVLDHRVEALDKKLDSKTGSLEVSVASLAKLVLDLHTSLQREMQDGFQSLRDILDRSQSRLDRHGGMLAAGARWTTRMTQWSERVDRQLTDQARNIGDLRDRLRKLEEGRE